VRTLWTPAPGPSNGEGRTHREKEIPNASAPLCAPDALALLADRLGAVDRRRSVQSDALRPGWARARAPLPACMPERTPASSAARRTQVAAPPAAACKEKLYTSQPSPYITPVIRSFRSCALAVFWGKDDASKIRPDLVERVRRRLDALHAARRPEDMNVPGFDFHRLRGRPVRYSVHVNGPWTITFGWDREDAVQVDLEQYH
jgi:proteic killer suppression protein